MLTNLHDPPKLNLNPNKALGDCTPRLREGKESQSGQGYRLWALTTGSNLCKPPHIKRLWWQNRGRKWSLDFLRRGAVKEREGVGNVAHRKNQNQEGEIRREGLVQYQEIRWIQVSGCLRLVQGQHLGPAPSFTTSSLCDPGQEPWPCWVLVHTSAEVSRCPSILDILWSGNALKKWMTPHLSVNTYQTVSLWQTADKNCHGPLGTMGKTFQRIIGKRKGRSQREGACLKRDHSQSRVDRGAPKQAQGDLENRACYGQQSSTFILFVQGNKLQFSTFTHPLAWIPLWCRLGSAREDRVWSAWRLLEIHTCEGKRKKAVLSRGKSTYVVGSNKSQQIQHQRK